MNVNNFGPKNVMGKNVQNIQNMQKTDKSSQASELQEASIGDNNSSSVLRAPITNNGKRPIVIQIKCKDGTIGNNRIIMPGKTFNPDTDAFINAHGGVDSITIVH